MQKLSRPAPAGGGAKGGGATGRGAVGRGATGGGATDYSKYCLSPPRSNRTGTEFMQLCTAGFKIV